MSLHYSQYPAKKTRRGKRHDDLTLAPLLAHTSQVQLARRSGIALRTVNRDAHRPLTIERASLYADTLRVNPAEVWPAWVGILEVQRKAEEAARRRKSRRRAPAAVRERERAYARDYRASIKAEHIEQWKANRAAYFDANRDRLLAQKRDRYQSDPEHRRRTLERQRTYDRANREAINARKRERRAKKAA